jgi:predicted nucleic-acid-binding protein
MRAVDTNVVARLVVRDDLERVHAAEQFIHGGAWVSHLVVAELTWVLDAVCERSAGQIALGVDMLLNHKDLTVQDADIVTSALAHFRKRPALEFSECLMLEVARKAGHLPLGTFDRALAKLDGAERLA